MKSYLRPGPYPSGEHKGELALVRAVARQLGDIGLRFRTLFRRLGGGLDGPGGFGDADAWYCILEGPAEVAVAEAQARALVDLLASYAARPPSGPGQAGPGERREILLAVDEFSAVSRRLPVWQLYERARSLGLAVQVSAQSWPGLAADEDERYRIAASADGGIWLLRTPHPEPAAALAGTRKVTDTTRRLLGMGVWGHQGTSRMRLAPVVDPARVRALDVGQAAYIYRGGVTYVQVKRLVAPPAALSALGVRPGWPGAAPAAAQQPPGAPAGPRPPPGPPASPQPPPPGPRPGAQPSPRPQPALPDVGPLPRCGPGSAAARPWPTSASSRRRRAALAGRAPLRPGIRALFPAPAGAADPGAATASAAAVAAAGPHPAAPALVTGVATWLVLTARHDLAPPR